MVANRFIAGTVAGAALMLGLTGCDLNFGGKGGGGGGQGAARLNATEILQKVSQRVDNTGSFKSRINTKGTVAGAGAIAMRGTMFYRARPEPAWRMRLTRNTVGGRATPGGTDIVLAGKSIYVKSSAPVGGKPWLRISLSKAGRQGGLNTDAMLRQGRQMDLSMLMKLLTASKDAREVGSESVDGVRTTHYTGTYVLTDGLGKLDARTRQDAQNIYKGLGLDKLGFDLWVDGQRVPRKLVTRTLPGAPTKLTTSQTFYDIGKPVSISAPPASKVTDLNRIGGLRPPSGN